MTDPDAPTLELDPAGPRYEGYAGFVTTPRYFDDAPQRLLEVAPARLGVMQRVLHVPAYEYRLDQRAANFDLLTEAAEALASSHCQVIGQAGTNWVHCQGTTGPEEIETFCRETSTAVGATFLMAGHCLVEALRHLGARRIAVANGYYRDDWRDGINDYLAAAGFEIIASGHMRDQGIYASLEEQMAVEEATLWDHPDRDCVQTVLRAHEAGPDADVVVQTGSGMRIGPHVASLEAAIGKPVVASDNALQWGMLRALDLGRPVTGWGALLGTLA